MKENRNIQEYLTAGAENIIRNLAKASLSNPAQSIFITKFGISSKMASKKRRDAEKAGEHIPNFLIASITSSCNLHCTGYYARSIHSCEDTAYECQLSADEWDSIFEQAEELGINFVILVGGEPMIRRDVIEKAGKRQNILFPIFTNGILIDDAYIKIFNHI